MNPDQVFSICSTLVLPGWLLLIFIPQWRWTERIITGIIVMILSLIYTFYIVQLFTPGDMKSFGSLKGVMQLFTIEEAVLAGWIHYLAFDLMIGLFEVKNAQKHRINHMLIIPCLLLTFMFGPVGLLLFFIIRMIRTKNYFTA